MRFKRDFTFNKDMLIGYYKNLKQFVGKKISQKRIAHLLQEEYPDNSDYNALDRKLTTLKFYGFVYFNDNGELMFNVHFEEYVNCLKTNQNVSSSFLKVLRSSKYLYYENSATNFFELLISLLNNKSILYLDHIDIITYLQHYNLINDYGELVNLIKINRTAKFADKVKVLETFYDTNNLGNIAITLHDAKYLFSFLENNGFYTTKNSLQSEKYYQGETLRRLEDRRLYLSKDLLKYINGYDYESIVDEIEYNSELESGLYDDPVNDVPKLIDISKRTGIAVVKRYKTDRKLRNNALKKSGYVCEMAMLNGKEHNTFPSKMYDGDYAEVHHLIPMHAQENDLFLEKDKLISLDQISNLIVLCPTCHSKLHYGKSNDVRPELELLFNSRKNRLYDNNLLIDKEKLLEFYNI